MTFSFEPFLAISDGHIMAVSTGPEHLLALQGLPHSFGRCAPKSLIEEDEEGYYRIIDETGDDYLYDTDDFEVVEESDST